MLNEFGYMETFEGKKCREWRGVVNPMPNKDWTPSHNDSWIFAKTKSGLENMMRKEVTALMEDCKEALFGRRTSA